MKRYNFALAAILAVMAMLPAVASATPVIVGAVPNFTTNKLTITGTGFGSAVPTLKIDAMAATVVSHTATTVVADLPAGIGSGTYQLTVTTPAGMGSFDLTLGTVGPQGPAGPQRRTGGQGSSGPQGPPRDPKDRKVPRDLKAPPDPSAQPLATTGITLPSFILQGPVILAHTPPVSTSGIYYVSGVANVSVGSGDTVSCFIASVQDGNISTPASGSYFGAQSLSISAAPYLNAGDELELFCTSQLENQSSIFLNGGFTAMLTNSSNNNTYPAAPRNQR